MSCLRSTTSKLLSTFKKVKKSIDTPQKGELANKIKQSRKNYGRKATVQGLLRKS